MVEKAKEEGVEAAVKVETARRMTEAEIESHYQAFQKKTRGGK